MALKAQVIDDSVTPNAVVVAEVPSAADMDAKQNRTRNLIILTAISNTRTLDGTEDVIIATGASPTSIFDPGSLPVLFELEVRNDSSVNCVFNPDIGSTISIPPGESVMLRQIAAGSWVNALDGLATLADLAALGPIATYRIGAALKFDVTAQYNTAASPSNATVTLDLSGAVNGTSILCYFNHGAEPTWPSGITVGGNGWVNSGLNIVMFSLSPGGVVSGVIISSNTSYVNPEVVLKPTAGNQSTTGITPVSITGMSFTANAATDYAVEICLQVTGTLSGGVCLGFFSSVGTDQTFALNGNTNNSTAGSVSPFPLAHATALNNINSSPNASVPRGSASVSSNGYIHVRGKFRGGASASTIDLRFISYLTGENATILALGSYMKVTRC